MSISLLLSLFLSLTSANQLIQSFKEKQALKVRQNVHSRTKAIFDNLWENVDSILKDYVSQESKVSFDEWPSYEALQSIYKELNKIDTDITVALQGEEAENKVLRKSFSTRECLPQIKLGIDKELSNFLKIKWSTALMLLDKNLKARNQCLQTRNSEIKRLIGLYQSKLNLVNIHFVDALGRVAENIALISELKTETLLQRLYQKYLNFDFSQLAVATRILNGLDLMI
jgi:hypothetical protein